MDKTIVVLLIGTLIIGVASGFVLNYFMYQPQIQSLRSDIASLEDEIDSYLAENEENLSELNEVISDLNATIVALNSTSGTPANETEIEEQLVIEALAMNNGTHFEITFVIINTGTAPATLNALYLYQYPINAVPDVTSVVLNDTDYSNKTFSLTLSVGASMGGAVTIIEEYAEGFNFQLGTTLEFRFISAQGYTYPKLVTLQ